jgi:hypothetical protein
VDQPLAHRHTCIAHFDPLIESTTSDNLKIRALIAMFATERLQWEMSLKPLVVERHACPFDIGIMASWLITESSKLTRLLKFRYSHESL